VFRVLGGRLVADVSTSSPMSRTDTWRRRGEENGAILETFKDGNCKFLQKGFTKPESM